MTETFENTIREKVEEKLGEGFRVGIRKVRKNNGVMKTALETVEENGKVGNLLYLDKVFREDMSDIDLDLMIEKVSAACKETREKEFLGTADSMTSWAEVRGRLFLRLINTEWNADILENTPHRNYLDLSVVYVLNLGETDGKLMSTMVNRNMMENWGVSEEALFLTARKNMKRKYPAVVKNMGEALGIGCALDEVCPLRVLTNKDGLYGAAAVLYAEDIISEMAEEAKTDVYILPSSVHEVLLLVKQAETSEGDLVNMVRSVNREQVAREEWLSDNVYCYSYGDRNYRLIK